MNSYPSYAEPSLTTTPYRVLCVDDDPAVLDTTATFLERKFDRIDTETVSNPQEGLSVFTHGEFDCIVSDYNMPSMDGLEFLEAVRRSYPHCRFIPYTGNGSEQVASEAIRMGVTDYVKKTTGAEQYEILGNRVKNAVEKRRAMMNYREIFQKIPVGVTLHHPETGRIVSVNRAFAECFGANPEELIGVHPSELSPEDSALTRQKCNRLIREAVEENVGSFECHACGESEHAWSKVTLRRVTINGQMRVLCIFLRCQRQLDQ